MAEYDLKRFGGRLAYAIDVVGQTTRAQLARDLDVKPQQLSIWLGREDAPSKDTIKRLAAALPIDSAWLQLGVGHPVPCESEKGASFTQEMADASARLIRERRVGAGYKTEPGYAPPAAADLAAIGNPSAQFERRMDEISAKHPDDPYLRMLERENLAAAYRADAVRLAEQAAVIRAEAIRSAERASELRAEAMGVAEREASGRRLSAALVTPGGAAAGTPIPPGVYEDFLRVLEAMRQSTQPPAEQRQVG